MKEIPLTQGRIALVDDEDFDLVSRYKWHVLKRKNGRCYAGTQSLKTRLYMHRLILNLDDKNIQVDHKDNNGLNNQRHNMRECIKSQNMHNVGNKYGSSIYKGVYFNNKSKKWRSQIKCNNIKINLGSFANEVEAAIAYNNKAVELHGDFARLNII